MVVKKYTDKNDQCLCLTGDEVDYYLAVHRPDEIDVEALVEYLAMRGTSHSYSGIGANKDIESGMGHAMGYGEPGRILYGRKALLMEKGVEFLGEANVVLTDALPKLVY